MKKFWRRMRVTVTRGVDAPSTAEPWWRWVTHGVDAPSTAEPWLRWSAFGQVGDRGPLGAPGDRRRGADGIKIMLAGRAVSGAAGTYVSPVRVCLCLRGLPSARQQRRRGPLATPPRLRDGASGHPRLAQETGPSRLLCPLPVTRLHLSAGNSSDCRGGRVLASLQAQRPGCVAGAVAWNPSPQGPCTWGVMVFGRRLEVLNSFLFQFVFCKQSPAERQGGS